MQGYILNINKVKDEDLIVSILTRDKVFNLYRFYGSRHSTIQVGYMIDFEIDQSSKSQISLLRNVLHLGTRWQFEREKIHFWQSFMKLLYAHLKDVEEIESYFFQILTQASSRIEKQNAQRVLIESYISILENEGRLHRDFECMMCGRPINEDEVELIRSFQSTHQKCLKNISFAKDSLRELFLHKSTILFDDYECNKLWNILLEGL